MGSTLTMRRYNGWYVQARAAATGRWYWYDGWTFKRSDLAPDYGVIGAAMYPTRTLARDAARDLSARRVVRMRVVRVDFTAGDGWEVSTRMDNREYVSGAVVKTEKGVV